MSEPLRDYAGVDRARDLALGGGDDYELLLSVAPDRWSDLAAVARQCTLPLTAIGHISHGSGVTWSMNGRPYSPAVRGYEHFCADS
jgi:thiamine-monophosphate kinase